MVVGLVGFVFGYWCALRATPGHGCEHLTYEGHAYNQYVLKRGEVIYSEPLITTFKFCPDCGTAR